MIVGITGAGSMVGFYLAMKLIDDKNTVIGVDIEHNESIDELIKRKGFTFVQGDIRDFVFLQKIFENVDIIYHLASISSERLVKEHLPDSISINIMGTINCLQISRQKKIKLIYASSASVYSDPGGKPSESMASLPGKFYGTCKYIGEEFCRLYKRNFGLNYCSLRFSRIYGPRMKRNPIYDLSNAFAKGVPVKLYESLNCSYDFIFVKDAAQALCMAQESSWDGEINVATGEGVNLQKIYDIFRKISHKKPPVEILNDTTSIDVPNVKKVNQLGWHAKYTLEDGIRETFEYFKKILDIPCNNK